MRSSISSKQIFGASLLALFGANEGQAVEPLCARTPQVVFRIMSWIPEADYDCRKVSLEQLSLLEPGVGKFDALNISEVKAGDFSGLSRFPELLDVNLSHNSLTRIARGTFAGTKFTSLDLSNNLIASLETGAFSGLVLSQPMTLRANRLTQASFAPDWAKDATISILDLSDNKISEFTPSLLPSSTENVDLRWNEFKTLPTRAFDAALSFQEPRWMHIQLDHNSISEVGSPLFSPLPAYARLFLDVKANQITRIESGLFDLSADFGVYLDFEGNRITTVPAELFVDSRSATKVNLNKVWLSFAKNSIREVKAPAFRSLHQVPLNVTISFKDNLLTDFPAGYVDPTALDLQIDLTGNPLPKAVKERLRAEYGDAVLLDP